MIEKEIELRQGTHSIQEYEEQKTLPDKLREGIKGALSKITEDKVLRLISETVSSNELRREVGKLISKESIYIARIPKKLEAGFNMGMLDFMREKSSGESLGVIIDANSRIRGNVRIEKMMVDPQFSSNIAFIAIQQQLTAMTDVIDDVRKRVISIQEGHDTDLFGTICGMHQQMIQMQDDSDPDTRKLLATQAITELNKVRGKIQAAVAKTLNELPLVDEKQGSVILEILKDKDYLSDVDEKYNRIEELTSYYLAATQLLGYAYAFLGEQKSFEDVFCPPSVFFDKKLLDKLKRAEILYENCDDDVWYRRPKQYFQKIKEASKSMFLQDEEPLEEIELTGDQILEAIGYESETEESH